MDHVFFRVTGSCSHLHRDVHTAQAKNYTQSLCNRRLHCGGRALMGNQPDLLTAPARDSSLGNC